MTAGFAGGVFYPTTFQMVCPRETHACRNDGLLTSISPCRIKTRISNDGHGSSSSAIRPVYCNMALGDGVSSEGGKRDILNQEHLTENVISVVMVTDDGQHFFILCDCSLTFPTHFCLAFCVRQQARQPRKRSKRRTSVTRMC